MTANVAVIYHSRKGTVRSLATEVAAGAKAAGATVRLRRVDGPGIVITDPTEFADVADLVWADAVVWGSPTHYGNVSAPLKRFMDDTSALWSTGELVNLVVSGLTSSTSLNGGQEGTLLSLHRSMYHWGALVASADPTAPDWHETGANAYGLSVCASPQGEISMAAARTARHLGTRMGELAALVHPIRGGREFRGGGRRILVACQPGDHALRALADALASGAAAAGAQVRTGLLGDSIGPSDVDWADGIAWGLRPVTGALPSSVAAFMERVQEQLPTTSYHGRVVTAFGTTANAHAGGESSMLSAYTVMHHWDAVVVTPGYTDAVVRTAGGNPYGTLHHDHNGPPRANAVDAARYQGRRLATVTAALRATAGPTVATRPVHPVGMAGLDRTVGDPGVVRPASPAVPGGVDRPG